MKAPVLAPQGKIIRMNKEDSEVLTDGLMICLDKMTKMKTFSEINNYLMYGEEDFVLREDIARLLLIATTVPKEKAPSVDISQKVLHDHVIDINSLFIKEFLELEQKNKKNAFMKSEFYKLISKSVEEMEVKYDEARNYYLNDGIILMRNIRNLYLSSLDLCIENDRLDARFREPLVELFQNNLDYTLNKIKNGVIKNVQVQARHQ